MFRSKEIRHYMEILVHIQNIQLVEKLLIRGRIRLEKQDHYQRNSQRNTQHPYCETEYPKVRVIHVLSGFVHESKIPRAFSVLQEKEKVLKIGTIKIKSTSSLPSL